MLQRSRQSEDSFESRHNIFTKTAREVQANHDSPAQFRRMH